MDNTRRGVLALLGIAPLVPRLAPAEDFTTEDVLCKTSLRMLPPVVMPEWGRTYALGYGITRDELEGSEDLYAQVSARLAEQERQFQEVNRAKVLESTERPEKESFDMMNFQRAVDGWMLLCFGEKITADPQERNYRFAKEALELVQALGMTELEALQILAYVYDRPKGDPPQEVGGVMVTLAALCNVHEIDILTEAWNEEARITTPEMMAKIRTKQATKHKR